MGPRRRYLDLAWGQAHVRATLGPGPLILALHKVTSASSYFGALIDPLAARGYSVAALDLPGYGLSDPPPPNAPLSWFAEAALQAVAALGYRSAWLLGNKTGASVALRAAVDFPDHVDGLLLWSVPFCEPDLRHRLATETVPIYGFGGEAILERWQKTYRACSPDRAEAIAAREVAEALLATAHQPAAHRALARDDHAVLLASVTQRTAIFANHDDSLLAESRRAAAAMPSATWTEFNSPRSFLADEEPEALAAFLDEFIKVEPKQGVFP